MEEPIDAVMTAMAADQVLMRVMLATLLRHHAERSGDLDAALAEMEKTALRLLSEYRPRVSAAILEEAKGNAGRSIEALFAGLRQTPPTLQ